MLERLKYMNHLNEVIDFGKDGIFVNMNDLHDYSWTVTKKNNRISSLDRTVENRKLPVIICCSNDAEGLAARNRLMDVAERDVLAMKHGRIIIGDYYLRCFITKSVKAKYLNSRKTIEVTLTLTTDFPYWVKESMFAFRKLTGGAESAQLDYSMDYPYDFTNTTGVRDMTNTALTGTEFKMIIYGPCSNPAVYVGGHEYKVSCDVGVNEYLLIDSIAKTVTLVKNDGTTENKFRYRGTDNYIFERIPSGKTTVSWEGDYGIDITLLEERSEPKWI